MEDYAEELRTPPVALVSVVGCPELHQTISPFLHAEQPPINTLALPDFSKVSVLARKPDGATAVDPGKPPAGILKREWLKKHRTRVPAVVAALFGSERVNGDPAQWLQVCTDLDNVKAVVRGRNIKLAVILVQTTVRDDVSDDLMIALKKRAEIDSKYLITFVQNDAVEQRKSLHRLASMFAELSNTYYREEGRRIKTRIEKKNFSSVELQIRYCFKVAVFAEFRRDWAEALRFYDDAYRALHEMIGISTRLPPIQCLVEIRTVAEQLHFKVSTLLLHGGKVVEAITWFRKHMASCEQLIGPPEVAFLHWEWLSRQFLVFAELLETSSAAIPSSVSPQSGTSNTTLTEWEFQSAYYYQLSACYLEKKRYSLDHSLSMPESSELTNGTDEFLESVVPSIFVGEYGRLLEQGDAALTVIPLSDAEYTIYALAEGKRFQDSFEIIALYRKAFESFNSLKAPRMASFCGSRMARENFAGGYFSQAKQVFDGITNLYRKEGWVTLLWESLGYLRECSRRLGLHKEFIEYSLEMAALPIFSCGTPRAADSEGAYGPAGAAGLSQREIIQGEVFRILKGEPISTANESDFVPNVTVDQPIHLEVDLVSPLRAVFLASVAFHDQVVKPGVSTLLTLSLLSQLPHPVEISEIEIQFNQPACNFTISSSQEQPPATKYFRVEGSRVENAPVLILTARKWLRLTCEISSGQSGKLECLSVTAKLGPYCTICCRAESPASIEELTLWKFDQVQNFPTKDTTLSISGQKVIQVEEPDPQVDLTLHASSPALVGEIFTVPVSVVSKGHPIHSGELKINLVDARGGGLMSPGEVEPFSSDSHHVELLSVSGMTEDESHDTDNIRKIQHSFGLVSVPTLAVGESWSCKIEITWHKPKPIMLYVSLGYCPTGETASQRVNVHRSLQIEGKTPVMISHRFLLPFRCEPLLLSKIKTLPEADQSMALALDETSILIVSARNCCEVPLQLITLSIQPDGDETVSHSSVQRSGGSSTENALIVPGEEFKQVFSVVPKIESPNLVMGSVCLRGRRDLDPTGGSNSGFLVQQKLPDVKVEKPPLVLRIECPPYAVLGVPFTFYVRVQNQTNLLQEINYLLGDSQSFVFSGAHHDTTSILPKSECIINYKVVPLGSGSQQLPQLTVTSIRYSARLHPSVAASTIFIFPSQPHFDVEGASEISDPTCQ
uniref:Trafficking protein particle complex subunit 11 n=1 Tax=Anthurium amnicola TaxID=1678845 RepID=A0A1D1ZC40_9ARAE